MCGTSLLTDVMVTEAGKKSTFIAIHLTSPHSLLPPHPTHRSHYGLHWTMFTAEMGHYSMYREVISGKILHSLHPPRQPLPQPQPIRRNPDFMHRNEIIKSKPSFHAHHTFPLIVSFVCEL